MVGERLALNVLPVLAVDDFKVSNKAVISESLDYFGDGFGDVFAHALQIFYLVKMNNDIFDLIDKLMVVIGH